MKAYLFNTQHGLYEGETFEKADMLQYEDDTTPLAPPDYEHGQVPVFDRQSHTWTVIPIGIARQLLKCSATDFTENQS